MCWKLKANIPDLETVVNDLEKMKISKDFELPNWEWKKIIKNLDDLEDSIIKNLALCLPNLYYTEHKEDKPDFFGQVYNTICEECYDSLISKNISKFNSIFPSFFIGSLLAYEKLEKKLKKFTPLQSIPLIIEPLMDLFEISGYAIIYSELFEIADFRNVLEGIWNNYFKQKNKPGDIIKMLIEIYNYKNSVFQLMPRDILRTAWQQRFNQQLRDLKLINGLFYQSDFLNGKTQINHKSSLIRALCRGGYEPHIRAGHVFVVIFLLKLPEAKGITFNDVYKLSERLNQENNVTEEDPNG
jgi:hypothetical protein